jgi:hypothetical protein
MKKVPALVVQEQSFHTAWIEDAMGGTASFYSQCSRLCLVSRGV